MPDDDSANDVLLDTTIEYLRGLTYDPKAERRAYILPVATIYWPDELPDEELLRESSTEALWQVFRLMSIRKQLWDDEELSIDEQTFWSAALSQAPNSPIFQRMEISKEDHEQHLISRNADLKFLEELKKESDESGSRQQAAWKKLCSWWSGLWS